jgi:hypothetical protein
MIRYCLAILVAGIAPYVLADAVDVTLTGPTSITIPEDGAPHFYTYTLTNNSGELIDSLGVDFGLTTFLSGDNTDTPPSIGWGKLGCGLSLADSANCTLQFQVSPESGLGETDADFGAESLQLLATFNLPNGVPDSVTITPTITVTDPGFRSVPEPRTLALLGAGLAGLSFTRRRKSN